MFSGALITVIVYDHNVDIPPYVRPIKICLKNLCACLLCASMPSIRRGVAMVHDTKNLLLRNTATEDTVSSSFENEGFIQI